MFKKGTYVLLNLDTSDLSANNKYFICYTHEENRLEVVAWFFDFAVATAVCKDLNERTIK